MGDAATEAETKTYYGVVTGKDYSRDGKVGVRVASLDDGLNLTGETHFYLATKFKARPGNVYSYRGTVDGSAYYPSSVEWYCAWPDQDQRLQWEAAARAFDVAHEARSKARAEITRNLIEETLAPLRRAYFATNAQSRLALKVLVLHYLEHGDLDL